MCYKHQHNGVIPWKTKTIERWDIIGDWRQCARTDEQIATHLNVQLQSLQRWMQRNPHTT